jgi:Tfp pilus assembly protein PilF
MQEDIEKLLARAHGFFELGRYQAALSEVQKVLAQDPNHYEGQFLFCRCLHEMPDVTESLEQSKQLVGTYPEDDIAHQYLAIASYNYGDLLLAESEILESIRINPFEVNHFSILSTILWVKDEWQRSLDTANQGLELDPENLDCLNLRIQCLVRLRQFKEVESSIKNILLKSPDYWYSHSTVGASYLIAGRPTKAKTHLKKALQLEPTQKSVLDLLREAIKEEVFIYRKFLNAVYSFATKSEKIKWAFIWALALVFLCLVFLGALIPFLMEVYGFLLLFLSSIWMAPFGYFLMLRDPLGRMLLTREEKTAGWISGIGTGLGFLMVSIGWIAGIIQVALIGATLTLLTIPIGRYFIKPKEYRTGESTVWILVITALGLVTIYQQIIDVGPEGFVFFIFCVLIHRGNYYVMEEY